MSSGVFCPDEVLSPVVLLIVAVGPEEPPEFLDGAFSLIVGLRVVPQGQADGNPQLPEECSPYLRDELGTTVGQDLLWGSIC